ncbi:hypothetical protein E4U60_002272 [Claviceps pazoutovae]|uniref:Uncharacterized protein n=1 Tax=Claviceps pazoutovae TaxID=1649127 RepID=A0A9P7MJ39_9HYPO|nr:hypothetical protein E4U60_002272 [Claviceps pazoutovae]
MPPQAQRNSVRKKDKLTSHKPAGKTVGVPVKVMKGIENRLIEPELATCITEVPPGGQREAK